MTRGAEQTVVHLDDPLAFGAFYREALPHVYGYFLNRCGRDRARAEDLTQETFMAAVRGVGEHQAITAPLPWIMGVARHKLVDHWRGVEREQRRLTAMESAALVEPQSDLLPWDEENGMDQAARALSKVPAAQRAALVLHHVDGLSVDEAADVLGRSIPAVESLLARGRITFRNAYKGAGP